MSVQSPDGSTRLPSTFWYLFAGTLINRLGAVVMPMMAIFLSRTRHLPPAEIGVVVALFGAGSFCAAPMGGWLADRFGRRRVLMAALSAGAFAMLGIAYTQTLVQISVALFALGFFGDLYRPVVQAMLSDVVPEPLRTRAYGYVHWAINLGFAVAVTVGGWLAEHDVRWLFLIDAATTLAFVGVIYWRVTDTGAHTDREPGFANPFVAFNDPNFALFAFASFLVVLVFMQFSVALPLDLLSRGIGPQKYGALIAINGVMIVILQPFWVRRAHRWRPVIPMVAGALLTGIGFALHGVLYSPLGIAFAVAIWTFGEIGTSPLMPTITAAAAPPAARGRYQGAMSMAFGLALLLGPLVGNWLLGAYGSRVLWSACLVVSVIGASLYAYAIPKISPAPPA